MKNTYTDARCKRLSRNTLDEGFLFCFLLVLLLLLFFFFSRQTQWLCPKPTVWSTFCKLRLLTDTFKFILKIHFILQ